MILLFTDPTCGSCNALLPEISRWQQEHQEKLTIVLISRGHLQENRTKAQEHGLTNVVLQEDWEVSEAYRVGGTPAAVFVTRGGIIGSSMAYGVQAIRALVERAAALPVPAAKEVGDPAPEVILPDLEGRTVRLEDFRGQETLVLFWNPGCGFCQQILPDLKEWEENPPEGAPKLLFVSAGTEEAIREMGLRSTVVLDEQSTVGWTFGASLTPSAVLVDAEGKVASEVAVGAPAVLELAWANRTAK